MAEVDPRLVREARQIDNSVEVDLPPPPVHRIAVEVPIRVVLKLLAVVVGFYLLTKLWPLITLLSVSLMLAAALAPFMAYLEQRGLPRPLAIATIALSLLLTFVVLIVLVIPDLVAQTRDLVTHSDIYIRQLQKLAAGHGLKINVLSTWHSLPKRMGSMDGLLMQVMTSVFDGVVALVTVLFVTVYLLSDQENIRKFFVGLFPERRRVGMLTVLAEMRRQVGGYARGQIITSILQAIFSFIVLIATGVPHPVALAVFAGLMDFVPLFGGMLATTPAVLIALTISPVKAVLVLLGYVVYQQIENHVIAPRVYSNTMNVSPLVALVGLLVGAELLGILGMLIALPVVAALPVVLDFAGIHLKLNRAEEPVSADPTDDLDVPEERKGSPATAG